MMSIDIRAALALHGDNMATHDARIADQTWLGISTSRQPEIRLRPRHRDDTHDDIITAYGVICSFRKAIAPAKY